jgi:hypothetical protein
MTQPPRYPIPVTAAGYSPLRRPGSIRRTTSIDTCWPHGREQPRIMRGAARDVFTGIDGKAQVLDAASMDLVVSPRREILSLETEPPLAEAQELAGIRAGARGGSSRAIIARTLGHLSGTPLYQLLDDYSGTSLVSVWGWMRWAEETGEIPRGEMNQAVDMTDVCIGHAAGSTSLLANGRSNHAIQQKVPVGPFVNPADPDGWHIMNDLPGPSHRRARRIDLWREGDLVKVESWFQDSAPMPDGVRVAVHEYATAATITAEGTIADLTAEALILPYTECPGSVRQVHRLIGKQASALRETVSIDLAGPLGCTHLNDVLRALAAVPALAARLPEAAPA